jgi:hypothetical protein
MLFDTRDNLLMFASNMALTLTDGMVHKIGGKGKLGKLSEV